MNISYEWIRSLLPGLSAAPQALADTLAMQGAPVDEIVDIGGPLRDIRIARVLEATRHPNADRLNLCRVDAGDGEVLQVVCGAPNVRAGGVYPLAPVGARLPGDLVIRKSKIRGEESQGMLCSARELGLGREHDGIMELPEDTPIGASMIEALSLDDVRLVVDVTPNRPDLLSHVGIARELGAALGLPLQHEQPSPLTFATDAGAGHSTGIRINVTAPDLCPRYLGLVIRGVRVGPSPAWLAGRIRAIGLRPISNVVDATNYVLHGLGQPMHAFDLSKVGSKVVVRRAGDGETITTLDDVERKLTADMLVIADASAPIAVAGVMGGAHSEVDADTTDILLECALFDAASVRRTRRALGLSTDASYRFERGVDPDAMELALRTAADLIVATAGGAVADAAVDADTGSRTTARPAIALRSARVTQLLGVAFDSQRIAELLTPLGFDIADAAEAGTIHVHVPGHRSYDVTREEDLIEEVARRHGYDSFPDELRPFRPSAVPDDEGAVREDRLRTRLVGMGLMESRTLAFVPETEGDVALMLPLSSEEGRLRRAIVPSLLRRTEHNYTRGQRNIRLFEIGTSFRPSPDSELPSEGRHLGVVFTGARTPPHWTGESPAFDLWDLRGILAVLVQGTGLNIESADADMLPAWADDSAAWVARSADGAVAVTAAQVLPAAIDAPAWADPVFAIEAELASLAGSNRPLAFQPIPAYPAVERDLALLVGRDLPAADVLATVTGSAGPLLETAFPFDVYQGKGIDEAVRSIALRLRFRSADRTLTDEEVDRAVARVLKSLKENHGIERRV